MSSLLSAIVSQPAIWILIAITIAVIDLFAPSQWAVCAVHALLLPVAWRLLHRRYVSLLTATLMVAVVVPGLVHLVRYINAPAEASQVKAAAMGVIDPARVWTMMTLAAAGLFHINLMRARRRRLFLRRELQQKVRGRTNEVRKANQTLREEIERRRTTQHLLDQSETHLQSLIDRMQLQVLRKDRQGVITYANDTFCSQLGRPPSEVIGKLDSEFYPAELADGYRADDLHVMESGNAVDHVEEHPHPDGGTGYVQVFKAPEYDRDGRCTGIQVIFWDVTEKHTSAIALRDSEARKRALFETAGDAVLLADHEQRIIEVNPSASKLFHVSASQLVGFPVSDIATLHRSDPDGKTQRVEWCDLESTIRHDLKIRRSDGTEFASEVSVHRIPMGSTEGFAVIVRDVTVQREALTALREAKAAAEATSRTKSEFMAGVSHELRTPLGGITGLTELLLQTPLSPRGRQYVDMIRQSGSQLSDVIEDILDFSAIEAGQVQINPEEMDLHKVVGRAFKSLAARAVGKQLTMAFSIAPDTPRHVIADPKRVRQIITNLGGNAVKFTPQGEVTLRLAASSPVSNEDSVGPIEFTITVTDTGVGIPAAKQATVFEAFERGEEGTTRRFGGTGLGLSIANELAERMDGDITLRSEVNVGSTFTCRLRLPCVPNTHANESTTCGHSRAYVDTNHSSVDESIIESLSSLGIDSKDLGNEASVASPTLWVIAERSRGVQFLPRPRDAGDQVIWVSPLGHAPSEQVDESDIILTQPVLPDELFEAVSRTSDLEDSQADMEFDLNLPENETASAIARGIRLLVVDDSPVNRTVIRDQLLSAGYQIDVAGGGEEAIAMVAEQNYHCILMDLQMPDMDGTEATQAIRDDCTRSSRPVPPTIALTAHVTEEHRQQCRNAGMVGFITKPIDREKLILEIEKYAHVAPSEISNRNISAVVDEAPLPDTPDSWRARMRSHSGTRPETLLAMCDAFLGEVPTLVERVRTSVQQNDAATLKTASHTLKSCLAYVAVDDDVAVAAEIEANSKYPAQISREQVNQVEEIAEHWISCVRLLREETAASLAGSS